MPAVRVVVTNVIREQPSQVAFLHNDSMLQQVASATFDPTLRHTVLTATLEGGLHGAHLQGSNGRRDLEAGGQSYGELQPALAIPVVSPANSLPGKFAPFRARPSGRRK
jgi:hypothetical protein